MSFIHQDDKQLYNNALTHLLEEKAESEIDFRLLVKGETRRVKALFKLIQHAGSQQCLTIIQDCTAQYKQLERFEELSLFSATLSDAIEEACFVTDDRHYIVEWNKNFASHFTKENMPEAGRHLFDLLPDLNDPAFIQEIRQALEGKTVERKTMQTTTGGGWRKHKMIQLQREGSNRVLHILEDNRRNEQLKQRLSANLALLESVLDAIEDRVVVMDKNMNYLYWNRACETYFGIKRNEVVGKNILELSPVFYDDPLYNAFRKALRGEIVHLESPLPGADNRQTSTLLIPVKSDSSNELAFLLWIGYRQ